MKRCLLAMTCVLPLLLAAPAMAGEHAGPMGIPGGRGLAMLIFLAALAGMALAGKVGWLALSLLSAALRPAGCRRGAELAENHFGRSFLLGLLVMVAYLLLFWLAWRIGLPWRRLGTVPLIVLFLVQALAGFACLATALGERLEANLGWGGGSTVRAVLLGGGILVLVGFFPVLGQLLDFVVLAAGLGVAVQVVVQSSSSSSSSS
jgi:hypothetical protein